MNVLISYVPLLVQGATITIAAWFVAALLSLSIGFICGILSCDYLNSGWIATTIRIYTFIAKGIPAYVQILIAYFVLPAMLGIPISGFVAATGALAFCSSGYVTEIVRAGINALAQGQWDACFVLGYSLPATLIRIILPQACAHMLPALLGELEQLLKSTSLLAAIGVMELTRAGMNIISRELNPLPVYGTIACIYLFFSALLQLLLLYIERKKRYAYR